MKAVILAGGAGTRISEETNLRPKPMIEIGGKPIIWHIMKIFSAFHIYDFIICLGYKGYLIKEYFSNYYLHTSDVTFDMKKNCTIVHQNNSEPWRVTLVETGEKTMTGGRLKKTIPYLDGEDFCFTYGDGVGNVDIKSLIQYHYQQKTLATLTAVQTLGRFGALDIVGNKVTAFKEKPREESTWINGGFFVLSPKVLQYIDNDYTVWEQNPLEALAQEGELSAFFHKGFWHPMDTLRDKTTLETFWSQGNAPWKIWDNTQVENTISV